MEYETSHKRDIHAINGKLTQPAERFDTVVIGAGSSGCAAAIEAAKAGGTVLLVDENPVRGALMGHDIPLWFGGRMTTAALNSERMLEAIFTSEPLIESAIDAGVEVLLGTSAWGIYRNGQGSAAMPEQAVALANEERSWLVGFDHLILATGARDLAIAFPGWNQPGVMGARALQMLLTRYDTFAGRRMVVAGTHDLALETALLAQERGIEVAAIVEVRDQPQGSLALVAEIEQAGTPIIFGTTIAEAMSGLEGVTGAILGNGDKITCDTICMAVGLIPAIELVDAMHGKTHLDPLRGGFVPGSNDRISVVGDCAGLKDEGFDHIAYRMDWARALMATRSPDTIICQCEEVTQADLIGVQPPRYLERPPAMAARSLETLLADGPANQDQIKRLTRAGMGVCQGRRCRDQVAMLLAIESEVLFGTIPLASHRAPVRPLPLGVIADWEEQEEMRTDWDVWLGIPEQWLPYSYIGTPKEDEYYEAIGDGMGL